MEITKIRKKDIKKLDIFGKMYYIILVDTYKLI